MPATHNPIEPEELLAYLISGQTLEALVGDKLPSPRALYAAAYDLYNEGKFEEALPIFLHLIIVNHVDKRYYDGAGSCLQKLGRFKDALTYHGVSTLLDLTDPLPAMRSAECNLALGNRELARENLEHAIRHARPNKKLQPLADRAEAMLEFLRQASEPAAPTPKTTGATQLASSLKE
ncbi:hypothetical protein [Caenimonas sp. SL110]|uniref:hypothetical protein n=1 Tax=Caenimonas sp. SL110 TaxID=1450524 RepID=UPI0006533FA1|nr:hypothetical protein [Caenimonas sp. SL110]